MKTAQKRFDKKVDRAQGHGPDGDCQLWAAYKTPAGYGQFYYQGGQQRAHRVAYQLRTGEPIPDGLFVLHSCDTPSCVNPDHLSLGTVRDNMDQMVARGRQSAGDQHYRRAHPDKVPRGEQLRQAKLTEDNVHEIRGWWATGDATQVELARVYGVSKTQISRIIHRKQWAHVTDPDSPRDTCRQY